MQVSAYCTRFTSISATIAVTAGVLVAAPVSPPMDLQIRPVISTVELAAWQDDLQAAVDRFVAFQQEALAAELANPFPALVRFLVNQIRDIVYLICPSCQPGFRALPTATLSLDSTIGTVTDQATPTGFSTADARTAALALADLPAALAELIRTVAALPIGLVAEGVRRVLHVVDDVVTTGAQFVHALTIVGPRVVLAAVNAGVDITAAGVEAITATAIGAFTSPRTLGDTAGQQFANFVNTAVGYPTTEGDVTAGGILHVQREILDARLALAEALIRPNRAEVATEVITTTEATTDPIAALPTNGNATITVATPPADVAAESGELTTAKKTLIDNDGETPAVSVLEPKSRKLGAHRKQTTEVREAVKNFRETVKAAIKPKPKKSEAPAA